MNSKKMTALVLSVVICCVSQGLLAQNTENETPSFIRPDITPPLIKTDKLTQCLRTMIANGTKASYDEIQECRVLQEQCEEVSNKLMGNILSLKISEDEKLDIIIDFMYEFLPRVKTCLSLAKEATDQEIIPENRFKNLSQYEEYIKKIKQGKHITYTCENKKTGLHKHLTEEVEKAAEVYYAFFGRSFKVTSGFRTLEKQAELMAEFSQEQLESLYGRDAQYIVSIKKLREEKQNEKITATDIYNILKNRDRGFVTRHICGLALDIAYDGQFSPAIIELLKNCKDFKVLDESNIDNNCIHVSLISINGKTIEPEIIKE